MTGFNRLRIVLSISVQMMLVLVFELLMGCLCMRLIMRSGGCLVTIVLALCLMVGVTIMIALLVVSVMFIMVRLFTVLILLVSGDLLLVVMAMWVKLMA